MGKIISSYIVPHPPVVIPDVGKGREAGAQKTIDSMQRAAEAIKAEKPTTIIVTTPHGPLFQDFIYMSSEDRLSGGLSRFGSAVQMEFENNLGLMHGIIGFAQRQNIPCGGIDNSLARKYRVSRELDHGALVPLYYVRRVYDAFQLVHISIAGLPLPDLYRFGMCIARAVQASEEQVVFIASGDLSHKLSEDAPYGYDPTGEVFDRLLVDSVRKDEIETLLEMEEGFCESAGECGLRSFIMMYGALDGCALRPEIYSYEGPFGVGYAVARLDVGGKDERRQVLRKVQEKSLRKVGELRKREDAYVSLARQALETYVGENKVMKAPAGLPAEMLEQRAGTFVSVKKQGQLRGCIGTTAATKKNIAEEIIYNAISAGTRDPRFDPVEGGELDQLVYSVDVLKEPEPIRTIEELDVVKYGVIVRAGSRSGLLLPNLEGVDTPEKQVAISLQKAGIRPDERYAMERFEVVRHKAENREQKAENR